MIDGIKGIRGDLVTQFPTNDPDRLADAETDILHHNKELKGRNLYGQPFIAPIADGLPEGSLRRRTEEAGKRIAMLDIDERASRSSEEDNWPASVSRDEPEKLSAETKAHTFFVRTKKSELLSNVDVLGFIAKCPDAGDGQGVVVHRDVILSLAHHLLDKVHELEGLRKNRPSESRYDDKFSTALDQLGGKDAEIKELRAALGEAAIKIRRLESKPFK